MVDVAAGGVASATQRNLDTGASGNVQYLYDGRVYKIAESIAGGAVANVTFSSIPGTYRNLFVEWQARGDTAATSTNLWLQLNADTGSNYDYLDENISGTNTVGGGASAGAALIQLGDMCAASAPASTPSGGRIEIPNYAGTTFHKTVNGRSSAKLVAAAASIYTHMTSGWWRSTAAVTSIKLYPAAGNFIAGSSFQLYGEM